MNRYLVLAMRRAQFDAAVVPLHQQFLEELRAEGRIELSGPFGDKSGGAYLLRADDLTEAKVIAYRDPAHISGGWDITLYEWAAR
ncbi:MULTISPECIES: YciI family protein [unclassified Rhodanobacter]|jgi:uncharacterized protein YciI|uniref:YciI family protein n=1 Tax=unclassified Rhodanobacter TaxID=2621553 RepID=UPI0016185814|nr:MULTISPECIES: YciI family protein [unclassified Rhodanobacter]MBB6244068.1 uncharacterized protein YciI [Rhodanobacter sp. MP1X3]MBB6245858.1 uncharacterized protein YciI [Rhodanobacter sp. A1T4]